MQTADDDALMDWLTEQLAQQHWTQLADDVYYAERLKYALQKD